MLKKFVSIKGVGKFRNCSAVGDIEFRKLSLVYGENSRGKTTLAAILRSLQLGDPNPVLERRTIDLNTPPLIEILTEGGKLTFRDGTWSSPYPSLAVFDSHYVSQNVHSGDSVDHDHKKNLARIVVGEQGVILAKQVDDLDAEIRAANGQLATAKAACEKYVPQGVAWDVFLRQPTDPDIDSKIETATSDVAAITNAEAIRSKSLLATITLPLPPSGLDALLAKSLEDVAKDAEATVLRQVETHRMGAAGQGWLAQGLPYIHDNACPFCGQGLRANTLVSAYRSFFSDSYSTFKAEVAATERAFRDSLADHKVMSVQHTLAQNDSLLEFWSEYVTVTIPALTFESDVSPVLSGPREALTPYVVTKLSSPLEIVRPGNDVMEAREKLSALAVKIATYNDAIAVTNALIEAKKEEFASGDLASKKRGLARLQAQKVRHSPEAQAACDAYEESVRNKKTLDDKKQRAKADLEAYTKDTIGKYEAGINALLKRFNAGFRITGSRLQYVGGTTSSSFKLSINNVPIELGDDKTPPGTPCFRAALGSGDRNTLALAFFIVQVRDRKDIADLIIVLDDPFTSLDSFRQHATRDQVRLLANAAKQVIVLSHYPQFLQLIAEDMDTAQVRFLAVARDGKAGSSIRSCDLSAILARGYDQDIATIAAFHHGEARDLRSVVRCIRPVLETHIRRCYPMHFPENSKEWLGEMLNRICDAAGDDPIADLKPKYDDLSSLNNYTKRYHHDDNTVRADAGPIDETELQGFVESTLEFIGRL